MKRMKVLLFASFCLFCVHAFSQEMSEDMKAAIKSDDVTKLSALITKDNINNCYPEGEQQLQYSVLSQTVRRNAAKCFAMLIEKGADVNKACDGYVPPLMHAAKYGRLEMLKVLIAKGANINYKYDGDYTPAQDETPLTYAEKNNQKEVAEYIRSLKPKQ